MIIVPTKQSLEGHCHTFKRGIAGESVLMLVPTVWYAVRTCAGRGHDVGVERAKPCMKAFGRPCRDALMVAFERLFSSSVTTLPMLIVIGFVSP